MKFLRLLLILLALSAAAFPRTAGGPPRGQQAKSYWLEADYLRWRVDYEQKRDAEFDEARALDVAGVKPGMTVGEVGAGNGYFTLKIARRVGPSGKVYANDIVEDFLAEIRHRAIELKLSNIETVLGTATDPRLPVDKLDMVFMVRSLHDMNKPVEVLDNIAASLKPGAKVVVVEVEGKEYDGTWRGPTLQQFLDVIARSRFALERTDRSLPNPRSVIFILAPK
jgi:ubiquinone/menaquinone biosynthesis C-methylase UbiE